VKWLAVPVAATLAVVAAGCGDDDVAFKDVKPCLGRLGVVVGGPVSELTPPPGSALAKWTAVVAYQSQPRGANTARLRGYGSRSEAERELKRMHKVGRTPLPPGQRDGGLRQALGRAVVLDRTVILTWSTPPTREQSRRIAACFKDE
jgi:hypothetical protein